MVQIVEVLVAAGGRFQLAQPVKGKEPQTFELHAVGEDIRHGRVGKARDEIIGIRDQ